jgi:hypothetical protein
MHCIILHSCRVFLYSLGRQPPPAVQRIQTTEVSHLIGLNVGKFSRRKSASNWVRICSQNWTATGTFGSRRWSSDGRELLRLIANKRWGPVLWRLGRCFGPKDCFLFAFSCCHSLPFDWWSFESWLLGDLVGGASSEIMARFVEDSPCGMILMGRPVWN